jgi:hypothetical protein
MAVSVGKTFSVSPAADGLLYTGLLPTTALSIAVSDLGPGESVSFTPPPVGAGINGISWQGATAYWSDIAGGEFSFMSKAQQFNNPNHWIYSESADAWRQTGPLAADNGHIWMHSHDAATGDYYYMDYNGDFRYVRIMNRSVEAGQGATNSPWQQTSTAPFELRSSDNIVGDLGWHPNLYGPGDGGLLVWAFSGGTFAYQLSAWRKQTDTWELNGSLVGAGENNAGSGRYLPGWDRFLIASGRSRELFLMEAGSGAALAANPSGFEVPPVRVGAETTQHGKLVVDPRNQSNLLLLGAQTSQVWTNTTGGTTAGWQLAPFTHPFLSLPNDTSIDAGSWTCGDVPKYGVVWGMGRGGSTRDSILWRPG